MKFISLITLVFLVKGLLIIPTVVADCTNRNADSLISKPNSLYTDNSGGTVIDIETGLMWQKCSLGLSGSLCNVGAIQSFSWQAALAVAKDNTDFGYNDWRLPNKNELASLIEDACFKPAINESAFPSTFNTEYWTSSPFSGDGVNVWYVDFSYGAIAIGISKNQNMHVRLVRGGRTLLP